MRFILSGGGTAGHIYPALTVAERLRADGRDEVLFVGTPEGLEARLVREAGVPFVGLAARGFDRSRPWTLVSSSATIAVSTLRAARLLSRFRPDACVGFGGYASIPVGLAARFAHVPLVLHEQNAVPGLANRQLCRWADEVAVTYPSSAAFFRHPERVTVTGNPVRPSILRADRVVGRRALGLEDTAVVLLVFGGSRGARHLNDAVLRLSSRILDVPNVQVVHVAGREEVASVRDALSAAGIDPTRWRLHDYIDDMGSALAAADLVLGRAGATSIAEITALGRPAMLVPYPYATDDHQTRNAQAMVAAGAAVVVADSELDASRFGDVLVRLLGDAGERARMALASGALGRPDAADAVAQLALGAGERVRPRNPSARRVRKPPGR